MRHHVARVLVIATAGLLASVAGSATAGAATTTTFSSPGEYTFTVPAGVTSITVNAIGAAGGACLGLVAGEGASVTATVPVTPGEPLFVGVGAHGSGDCGGNVGGTGGIGGGGNGGTGNTAAGAGGGGSSLVGVASPWPAFNSLFVIGGGGGGAGNGNSSGGGNGGNAGSAGSNGAAGATGGGAGTQTAGGSGGARGSASAGTGSQGSAGVGGQGGSGDTTSLSIGGGGGGGGYYGGGGGGGGGTDGVTSAGGGGGSSFVTAGASNVSSPTPTSTAAKVSITYGAPAGISGRGTLALITCNAVAQSVRGHQRTTQKCRARPMSGTTTTSGTVVRATITRGGVVYAQGVRISSGGGSLALAVHKRRRLTAGKYVLTLRWRGGSRSFTRQMRIAIR
jgi:hypothetical protein